MKDEEARDEKEFIKSDAIIEKELLSGEKTHSREKKKGGKESQEPKNGKKLEDSIVKKLKANKLYDSDDSEELADIMDQ